MTSIRSHQPPRRHPQIDIVNCVRRALEGRHQAVELSAPLAGSARLQRLLLDAVLAALPACEAAAAPEQSRERLRLLLLRTAQHAAGLVSALAQHAAGAALYSPAELRELVQLHTESDEAELPTDPPPAAAGIHDTVVEVRTSGGGGRCCDGYGGRVGGGGADSYWSSGRGRRGIRER